MPYYTTTDQLLENIRQELEQPLSTNFWINKSGVIAGSNLRLSNLKVPTGFNTNIPSIYNETYVAMGTELPANSPYAATRDIRVSLASIIDSTLISEMNSTYTAGITQWAAEVVDYKFTINPVSDGAGSHIPVYGLVFKIRLYVA